MPFILLSTAVFQMKISSVDSSFCLVYNSENDREYNINKAHISYFSLTKTIPKLLKSHSFI